MQMWQIVANLEFVTGFAINLQARKPNISPRAYKWCPAIFLCPRPYLFKELLCLLKRNLNAVIVIPTYCNILLQYVTVCGNTITAFRSFPHTVTVCYSMLQYVGNIITAFRAFPHTVTVCGKYYNSI